MTDEKLFGHVDSAIARLRNTAALTADAIIVAAIQKEILAVELCRARALDYSRSPYLPFHGTKWPTDSGGFVKYKNAYEIGSDNAAPVRANVFSNLREYVKNRRPKLK